MPPKKKASGKQPPKARTPTLIDGLTKEEISKEQLEEHIVRLREELDREREERNYFQLERDKIHKFWEITERKVEEAKAELKNWDKDMAEDERCHQVEIKVYKQKMKHLLCEHQNRISELKAAGLASAEVMHSEQKELEGELYKQMKAIRVDMQERDNEALFNRLEQKHTEDMTAARNSWEKRVADVRAENEEKLRSLRQELHDMRISLTSERQHHWNSHASHLMEELDKTFSEGHKLAAVLEQDNEECSKSFNKAGDLEEKTSVLKKRVKPFLLENSRIAKCISEIEEEIAEIQKHTRHNFEQKDFSEKARKKKLEDLKTQIELLEQNFTKLEMERDKINNSFSPNIQNVQGRTDQENVLLERKVLALTDSVEETQARLCSVLSASNVDQTALTSVTKRIVEPLESRNVAVKNLQDKVFLISTAHKNLLLDVEAKQSAHGPEFPPNK